jgi:hypothetical protein
VTFTGEAWFGGATFTSDAMFNEATFTSDAKFENVTFTGEAWFGGATFEPGKQLTLVAARAALGKDRHRDDTWPPGWWVKPDPSSDMGRLAPETQDTPT